MSQEVPFLVSSPTNLLTIEDVVLDSPVWRANVLHLEDQIDQFEKWIDGFIRALKSYIDSFTKYNTQAATLCKRTFFNGLDGTLIDTKIAGNIVNKFATTLQATVAHRMKTVSDLQDQLLNPLQNLVKNDLKNFKDSRKQFDKMLDKYETQLYRYNVLSKQKEASALREDAFQMYELRKSYVKNSGDYFSKLVYFKSNLENMLVECFSSALGIHIEEIDESNIICTASKANLPGWKQWLDESKTTCEYQVSRIKKRCDELQDIYIEQTKPHRSLKRYSTTSNDQMSAVSTINSDEERRANDRKTSLTLDSNTSAIMKQAPSITINNKSSNKQGYLNCRIISTGKSNRPPWSRKWVFLQDSWFGTCIVSTVNKEKGCIILGDRVDIKECVFRVCIDLDRRFCFEVVHPKCSYYLQAETEEEMQQWLWTIELNMEKKDELQKKPLPLSPQALLSPKSSMTSVNNSGLSLSTSSPNLIAMSTSPLPSPDGSHDNPIISTTTSSLTALMIRESENNEYTNIPQVNNIQQTDNGILSSWGMPWLSNGISAFSSNNSEEDLPSSSSSPNMLRTSNSTSTAFGNGQQLIVWPTKLELDVPTPNLSNYTNESSQRELRKLFDNVPEDEIVLESFLASLYRKPTNNDGISYGYSGTAYITQKSLWFYSCTLMTYVNMIIIPLEKIKSVRLEKTKYMNSMMMMIDVNNNNAPFSFGLWLESFDIVSERLKVLVDNAKQHNTTDLQSLYDTIRQITCTKLHKNKNPLSHVTTASALFTSLTPINVQAHQSPMQITNSTSTNESTVNSEEDEDEVINDSHYGSPAQGALTAVYNATKQQKQKQKNAVTTDEKTTTATATATATSSEDDDSWPSHIQKPTKEVKCDCKDHLEKIESDIILPTSAKKLFDLMFGKKNHTIWKKLNQVKNSGEPTLSEWSKSENNMMERTMSYIMPVSNPMIKATETDVIETQQIIQNNDYLSYVVMVSTKTPNLPYSDAYLPCIKYCITFVTPTTCRLVCSFGVNWFKFVLAKGIINDKARKGMQETIQEIIPIVKQELSKKNPNVKNSTSKRNSALPQIPETTKSVTKTKETKTSSSLHNLLFILFALFTFGYMMRQIYFSRQYMQTLLSNQPTIIWRGVYLKDIQNQVTEKEAELTQVNYQVYKLFQESRVNGTTQQWKEPWYSKIHKSMADELGYSRERIGAIRYELLSTFRILNKVEYQLLENEYWNWLADKKLRCKKNMKPSKELCKAFEKEATARDA